MNHGKSKTILALIAGLAAMVAMFLLLSTLNAQAVTLAVNSAADSGPGDLLPVVHRPSASSSSLCATTEFFYPLAISLDISDTFGPRRLLPQGYSRYDFHRGIDWPAPEGTPVYAVTTGTVRAFRDDWVSGTGSGNFVHLIHEHIGCETRYNHLWEVHVSEGDTVTPGQIIGTVGSTGATYAHLHFEVRQGLTVTQRAAVHPLSTQFLPWTNTVTPTVAMRGVYTDATGLTALVEATSPYTEPDVTAVGVTVSGSVADSRIIDYVDLNGSTTVVADLDDPLVNDVCVIPADLNSDNGYRVTMAFRRLSHGPAATVTAWATDVDGWGSTDTASLIGGLEVTPPEQVVRGVPGQTVTFAHTVTNRTGTADTFTLTHLSAQGWPAVVTPATLDLDEGQSGTVVVSVTLNTATFGPPDCGLMVATSRGNSQRVAAVFYRIYRDAYVSAETGSDITGTGSRTEPFATISYAIDQTDAGGTIYVAEGTYTNNLTLTKTIDLVASYPVVDGNAVDWTTQVLAAYSTTVDVGGNGAVLVIDGDYGPLVEGFTFVHGHRDGAGGGVRLVGGAAPTLRSNWILSNTADLSGGGIYIGPYGTLPPMIVGNIISGNTSSSSIGGGGGIYVKDRPALIQGNVISGNQATNNDGGGIYLTGGTTAEVLGNWILGNEAADDGGGVLVRNSDVYLANNVVADNRAHSTGSGLYITGSSPCLLHTTIARNGGGDGSGVYVTGWSGAYSSVALTNAIMASHTVGVYVTADNTATLETTLWYGNAENWDGPGTIIHRNDHFGNPAFVDPDAGDYHIGPSSAAIGVGVETKVTTDIDGDPRLGVPDIGADEYVRYVYLPLVLKDSATSFEYDVQGCLPSIITTDELVEIYVEGNDVVVHHYNAIYNCCAVIVVGFVDERPVLKLVERETYPGGVPCTCVCPYDINARIASLPSGNYRVEVWNEDKSRCYGWAEVTVP